jgi:3-hydroxy-9,10-secoandrosta-1,3,5(10)-triene-9,17-dione monooxygenase
LRDDRRQLKVTTQIEGAQLAAIPVPEPGLTPADMIARARALAPAIRADAPAAEKRGRYSEALHEQFRDAGFYRMLQPRYFGGYEFDIASFYRVIVEIATADPGIGWCLCLGAGHALQIGSYFEPEAQAEIFGSSGQFVAPLSIQGRESKPPCIARPDGDGYRVSGKWAYASGSPYSNFFMGGAQVGDNRDERIIVVVPRDSYEVLEDWGNVMGLKASGSNSVVIKDAWIPRNFTVPGLGPIDDGDTPGSRFHRNPMYAGQFMGFGAGELACSQVGAARAALAEFERIIKTSRPRFTPGVMKFEHHDWQRIFGLSMSMVQAAEAVLFRTGELYMEYSEAQVAGGDPFTPLKAWQLMGMQHQTTRLAWDAGLELFRAASTSNTGDGQPMQRFFRDLATFKNNGFHQPDFVAPEIARAYFGLPGEYLP